MIEITSEVRDLVRQRVTSMDHVEVLMRVYEAAAKALGLTEIEQAARLGPQTTVKVLADLVRTGLVAHDPAAKSYRYAATGADRSAVDTLAALYNQRPVTLVKLVYAEPPNPVKTFADAFRLREKDKGSEAGADKAGGGGE